MLELARELIAGLTRIAPWFAGRLRQEAKGERGLDRPLMRRRLYSLYILRHDPPIQTCTIALSKLPVRRTTRGLMPLANFPSWKHLASALSRVGISVAVLEKMEWSLDAEGLHTLTDLMLSDEQVASLGFRITV